MTPNERLALTRNLPLDLLPEEVVMHHGNAVLGPNYPCWYVTVRGQLILGYYKPDDAAVLVKHILNVSRVRAQYKAQLSASQSGSCPLCSEGDTGVCPKCVEAYQLDSVKGL